MLNEVHVFVVSAVRRFPRNATVQVAGLSCLALLSECWVHIPPQQGSPSGGMLVVFNALLVLTVFLGQAQDASPLNCMLSFPAPPPHLLVPMDVQVWGVAYIESENAARLLLKKP